MKIAKASFFLIFLLCICNPLIAVSGEVQQKANGTHPIHPTSPVNELDELLWQETVENGLEGWSEVNALAQEEIYWQASSWQSFDGNNWRCFDPDVGDNGGYDSHWLQWLITPQFDLSSASDATLQFNWRLMTELPGGDPVWDGWDGANVWVSIDNGETFEVVQPESGTEYNCSSLMSFGLEWLMGEGIPGWGGYFEEWTQASFSLDNYTGQSQVRVAFAFASDPGLSAADSSQYTGFQVDNVLVADSEDNTYFADDADGNNIGGEFEFFAGRNQHIYSIFEVDDAPSPTHVMGIEDIPSGFEMYYESPVIDLTDLTVGTTTLDVMVKGFWEHPVPYPDGPKWTVKVKPSDTGEWYYGSNPYDDPSGTNFAYPSAPDDWTWFSDNYNVPWDLTPYHGLTIQFRVEFFSPIEEYTDNGFIYWDDWTIETIGYEHDIQILPLDIPWPSTVGTLLPMRAGFYNDGTSDEVFNATWYLDDTPISLGQNIELASNEEIWLFMDTTPGDTLNGWIPGEEGEYLIRARHRLEEDQNNGNDDSDRYTVLVRPEGQWEFGADDRIPGGHNTGHIQGEGPITRIIPPEPFDSEYFTIETIRVMWFTDLDGGEEFTVHLLEGGDAPGLETWSGVFVTDPEFVFPQFQELDVSGIPEMEGINGDYWIWIELNDASGLPHIVRSSTNAYPGQHGSYDGTTLTNTASNWLIRTVCVEGSPVKDNRRENRPTEYSLNPAYPNPFNPSTTITFNVAEQGLINLSVYNVSGQLVETLTNRDYAAGNHKLEFDASTLPSGLYFVRMEAGTFKQTERILLLK